MKHNKYNTTTVGTVQKYSTNIVEKGKIPFTHKYMTAYFPGLVQKPLCE